MPSSAAAHAAHQPFTDKYAVARILGRGGMGTVFEARHERLGQSVAIKVLGEELRLHPELVRRFEREARAAGALTSPHAVRVFDIDQTEDGTPFIVMELLHGRDLADVVVRDGPQEIGLAVKWIIEACDAIAEAHRLGIVHRDIKPSNLLLCDTGVIKVLDFGIAKRVPSAKDGPREAAITLGVAPLGTPQYMSPEQVRCAKDVDPRSDIWSLGVTLYELLCGRPPYDHDLPQACIAAIVADPIPDPRTFRGDLPDGLVAVLLRALAKAPTDRFPSVDELVLALAPFATALTDSGQYRAVTMARRATAASEPTIDGAACGAAGEEDDAHDARDAQAADDVARRPPPATPPEGGEPEVAVPPTLTRASLPGLGRRVRSTLALVGAGILGLAALVSTPQCSGSRIEPARSQTAIATPRAGAAPPSLPNLPTTTIAAAAATNDTPVAPAAESASAAPPPGEQVRPLVQAKTKGRPGASPPASTMRFIGDGRPAHGGISNPGF